MYLSFFFVPCSPLPPPLFLTFMARHCIGVFDVREQLSLAPLFAEAIKRQYKMQSLVHLKAAIAGV